MFTDWRFWLFAVNVFSAVLSIVILVSVKFNDLKHLELDFKELKKKVNSIIEKLDSLSQRVSRLEGKHDN